MGFMYCDAERFDVRLSWVDHSAVSEWIFMWTRLNISSIGGLLAGASLSRPMEAEIMEIIGF